MNKLVIYALIGIACYLTYVIGGKANDYHNSKGKQGYDQIITIESKDISECSIATDKDVVFHPKDLEMYTDLNQGCTYKIWIGSGDTINEFEHVKDDGCE